MFGESKKNSKVSFDAELVKLSHFASKFKIISIGGIENETWSQY